MKEIPVNQRKLIAMAVTAQTGALCTSAQAAIKTDTPPTHSLSGRFDEICIKLNDEKMHQYATDGDPQAMTAAQAAIAKVKGSAMGFTSLKKADDKLIDTAGDGEEPHAKLAIPTLWGTVATRAKQPVAGSQFAPA